MSAMDTLTIINELFTFTQYRPLLPRQLVDEAKGCGTWLSEQELEAWHRVRLLVPFYRLARDGREIAAAYRRGEDAYHLAHWQPTSPTDLADARAHGPPARRRNGAFRRPAPTEAPTRRVVIRVERLPLLAPSADRTPVPAPGPAA